MGKAWRSKAINQKRVIAYIRGNEIYRTSIASSIYAGAKLFKEDKAVDFDFLGSMGDLHLAINLLASSVQNFSIYPNRRPTMNHSVSAVEKEFVDHYIKIFREALGPNRVSSQYNVISEYFSDIPLENDFLGKQKLRQKLNKSNKHKTFIMGYLKTSGEARVTPIKLVKDEQKYIIADTVTGRKKFLKSGITALTQKSMLIGEAPFKMTQAKLRIVFKNNEDYVNINVIAIMEY